MKMKLFVLSLAIAFLPHLASAQVVTAPTKALSFISDADFAKITGVRIEYFQCTSVTAQGTGVGCALAPFQAGVVVAKASISTLNPVDANGNNRSFSLTSGAGLASLPLGVPFVGTLVAIADPLQGVTDSPRSAASNPFFTGLAPLTAPTNLKVAQ